MNKHLMATAVAASTLGGAAAGATLLAPGLAGAQDGEPESTQSEADTRPEPGDRIREVLQPLVDEGTLTPTQVDAVVETLLETRAEGLPGLHRGLRMAHRFGAGADIAGLLGMDASEVRHALRAGSSIADLANDQGVDIDTIVDAIVAATEERVNAAVESGRITQDKADEILASADERAEDLVNGEFEGHRFRGPGPFTGADGDTEPAGA